MPTVSEDPFFRLTAAAEPKRDHTSGSMIALMLSPDDASRLSIPGGEPQDELHLTLFFLGKGNDWSPYDREVLTSSVRDAVRGLSPVSARIFGSSHWNGDTDNPSWVWSTGDDKDSGGTKLEEARERAIQGLEDSPDEADRPTQHSPWVPHICAAYSTDLSLLPELESRTGPVTFDRVRLSFGDEDIDIPLDGPLTAAADGPFRRDLTPGEHSSCCDFALMDQSWKQAVDSLLTDLRPVRDDQIRSIRAQILESAKDGSLDDLSSVSVDDTAMSDVLVSHMVKIAQAAGEAQQREAESQGVSVPEWELGGSGALTAAIGRDLIRQVARITSRLAGSSLVQSAVRRALSLVGRPAVTPTSVADDVSEHLTELSESNLRDLVSGAVTSAQNEGRRTVLAAAPPADYYESTEILDKNICKPCRAEDGTRYEKLGDATRAYPSGGFRDCLGGVRCRGTIVAVWKEGNS